MATKDKESKTVAEELMEEGQMPFDSMLEDTGEEAVEEQEEQGVETTALSTYSTIPSMDQDDVFIPRLKLAQGLSRDVQDGTARPGQWIMTGFEPLDEVTVVPLMFARRRELTDDEFNVLCKSVDSITGVGDPGGTCADCPMNQWKDGPKGRRLPPECTFMYSYVVYVVDHGALAVVDFKRTSIQAGKSLNTMVVQRGLGKFGAVLKSAPKQGPKGTYYQAVASSRLVSGDTLAEANQVSPG